MRAGALRVLVVDDSALMRQWIADLLNSDPEIEVVGTARDGWDALNKIEALQPTVVTLDLAMPQLSGLDLLRMLAVERSLPVVVVTGVGDTDLTFQALEEGAVDFVLKPSGPVSGDIAKVRDELVAKVKLAARVNLKEMFRSLQARSAAPALAKARQGMPSMPIVAIGASTGGPQAVRRVLQGLPRGFQAPVLVVQHMPDEFTGPFAERMGRVVSLVVREAQEGDVLEPGVVYVAPGGAHMKICRDAQTGALQVTLDHGPPVNGVRPSVDVLFHSLAEVAGPEVVAVVLTGMGEDGAEGIRALKARGATTLAQDAPSSTVFGMPRAAAETGAVDHVLPLEAIPQALVRLVGEKAARLRRRSGTLKQGPGRATG
ncbi:MAG: chemotaxis response regulator protein-glutamate methylesterase [Anaerolineae bacterium]|nr:chemotaxis response regulator protein-glutamate methylesterase [Anaerolineae bacterium]